MKRFLAFMTAAVMVLALILTGCGKKDPAEPKGNDATEEPLKVILLLNGTLGDKSFFDSANNGMELIKDEFGDKVETKTIEMTYDQTKWEPNLIDASEGDWDIIIVGTWQMTEMLEKIAPQYPDKKYIIFDTSVNYDNADLSNVYSIGYKQNEGSFLAGALAAKVTTSTMPLANPEKKVGFLGGMDNPVINDFLVGYIQGAQYIDKDVKVAISYIGDFADSAKGKEMALAQYDQGVDIGFNVAGQAGLGQLDAAKERNKYAIGVDSDQALQFASDSKKADLITTSVLKRVDNSLLRAIKMHLEGNAPYGKSEALGFKEECIGLAENDYYKKIVPEEYRTLMTDLTAKITSGEIVVDSALGMDTNQINEIRNSVKP